MRSKSWVTCYNMQKNLTFEQKIKLDDEGTDKPLHTQTDNAAPVTLQLTGIETVHIVIMQPNKWIDTVNKNEDGANDEFVPIFISQQHNMWIYKKQEV